MGSYSKLYSLYANAKPQAVDPMVLMMCKDKDYVQLEVLLSQYKSAVEGNDAESHRIMRNYLVTVFGSDVVDSMETIQ